VISHNGLCAGDNLNTTAPRIAALALPFSSAY
jgi:hypothetical protein